MFLFHKDNLFSITLSVNCTLVCSIMYVHKVHKAAKPKFRLGRNSTRINRTITSTVVENGFSEANEWLNNIGDPFDGTINNDHDCNHQHQQQHQ